MAQLRTLVNIALITSFVLGVVGMPEIEPGFFIDKCGNSREGFYHIETGKGVSGIC